MKDRNKIAVEKMKQKQSKKIIIYGETCSATTGNGKLIYFMAKAFQSAGHQVFTIGREYNAMQLWYDNIPILPSFHNPNAGMGSVENVSKIADYVNYLQPDFFICVGDPYQYQQFGIGRIDFKKVKTIMYATIDSEGMFCNDALKLAGLGDYLTQCDKVISTAKFTQEQLKKWLDIDSELIYETIDTNNYSPVSKEKKVELKKKHRFKGNDFVMYYSGRNLMRKRHNILLDACTKFICETENTYLYLNIPCANVQGKVFYPDTLNPVDFVSRVLKKKYGRDLVEEKRIIFIERGELGANNITEQKNAEFYQLSDVYVTTTGGEGFGLCPCESLSCGVPAIVPDNTTGKEIIGVDKGLKMPSSGFQFGKGGLLPNAPIEDWGSYGLKHKLTTAENTYNAIKFLYKDPELRANLGKQGREYVRKMFNIADFTSKWINVIKTTEKKPEPEFKDMNIVEGKEDDLNKLEEIKNGA